MNYAEARLVTWPPFLHLRTSNATACLQGPDRIKGAYAYRTLLQYLPLSFPSYPW